MLIGHPKDITIMLIGRGEILHNKGEVESEQHTMKRCTFYTNEQAERFALVTQ